MTSFTFFRGKKRVHLFAEVVDSSVGDGRPIVLLLTWAPYFHVGFIPHLLTSSSSSHTYLEPAPLKWTSVLASGTIVYGTDLNGLVPFLTGVGLHDPIKTTIDPVCKSCFQFLTGSDFLNKLNAGGDTVPSVHYKFIVSKLDRIITPYTNGKLRDQKPLVTNIVLQDLCVGDLSEHIDQMLDPDAFHSINAFLDSNAPQDVNCWLASWN
ncbi:MAG: hypothetical protein J3Q66DRAFT_383006 [Benniella sp.]|nr:MAG: hypothetical protein J3Q66DRAFT_383006 [Benniella sp.]